jgi:mannose-6-phosphate isomerase-like protein (cupin superfamily)
VFPAPTGSFVFVPKGKPHRFQNLGDGPARILVMTAPPVAAGSAHATSG